MFDLENRKLQQLLYDNKKSLASTDKRALALFLDELFLSIVLFVILFDKLSNASTPEEMILFINSFVLEFMVLKFIYQTFFIYKYGYTLGKMLVKIEVVDVNSLAQPDLKQAIIRSFFRLFSEMIMYLGYLWGIFDPQKQTWHDKLAKTIVINRN
jgi:uncharacterized RDD family membrane protein YckC